MLQAIRERLVGWILWVVVGFICVPFAFWGLESFRGEGGDPVVAKVGGSFGGLYGAQRITESQLRQAYDRRYQQMQQMMGDSFRADMIDAKQFRQMVLDDMIQELTLRQFSEDQGYSASDAALRETLRTIPAFQENGQFSAQRYQDLLSQQGYSPRRFEQEMRDSLAIDQLRAGVIETAFATDAQLAARYRLAAQQRTLSYARLEAARYQSQIKIDDDQVKARYEARKAQLMTPERIKLAYIELSLEQMPKAAAPDEPVLKALYESEKASRFSTTEERRARHILLGTRDKQPAAKATIEDLAAKLKSGSDFAELAKGESTDKGSAQQGGDLGWIRRGQMVPKFEEALFALKPGEISQPVETEFGWHLIKLDEVRGGTVQPYEEVKGQLLELYQKREAEKHFQEKQEKIEQLAFENPASLDPVASALGLEVRTTDWFGRTGGTGIAANQAVMQAAFSDEVLKNGENSKPLSTGTGNILVVRKAEYEAPRQKELAEVTDEIRKQLLDEAVKEKLKAEGRALQDAVRAGEKPDEAARKAGAQFTSVGAVRRDDAKVERPILRTLFHMPRPQGGAPSVEQVLLPSGDLAVVFLADVKDGELQTASPDEARQLRQAQRDRDAGQEFNAVRSHISDVVKVKRLAAATAEPVDEPAP